ncbi:MAG: sugar transferase [Desulfobaccales bacterium]
MTSAWPTSKGKRMLDLALAWPAFLLLSPVILLSTMAVRLTSPGPAFFRQVRMGKGGRLFRVLKLRTMQEAPPTGGRRLTVGEDCRITRVGRWLRLSKIDELPQLFNVLAGDMSLVGPRPEVPEWVGLYSQEQREILGYKPGMTDAASIFYRDESSLLAQADDPQAQYRDEIMPRKITMGLGYMRRSSLGSDLRLMLCTLAAISKR